MNNYAFSVRLPSQLYLNKTEGLCGNCNGDGSDDACKLNGEKTTVVDDFALSWLVEEQVQNEPAVCAVVPQRQCPPVPPEQDPCLQILEKPAFQVGDETKRRLRLDSTEVSVCL